MKIDLYAQNGSKAGTAELNSDIFGVPWNGALVHRALRLQLDNARHPIAKTKTRGDRRGGGRKPFKQKHTGRARAGSRRSPVWRKGGVTFGPTGNENYHVMMPKKQRNLALFSTLSQKARDEAIIGLESFTQDKPKTKEVVQFLKKLPVKRSCLIVIPTKSDVFQRSARNIENVKVINAQYLNIADLLKFHTILCTKEALARIDEIWGADAKVLAGSRSRTASAEKAPQKVKKAK